MNLRSAGSDASDIARAKAELRARALETRRTMDADSRRVLSASIEERLVRTELFRAAAVVHSYVGAVAGEVDTLPLLERALRLSKRVVCPRALPGGLLQHHEIERTAELVSAANGLIEPPPDAPTVDPAELGDAIVIVPGLAFDATGFRVGFGGGYYDRFLALVGGTAIGVAFHQQLHAAVPRAEHDVPVDLLVTDRETIDCRERRATV